MGRVVVQVPDHPGADGLVAGVQLLAALRQFVLQRLVGLVILRQLGVFGGLGFGTMLPPQFRHPIGPGLLLFPDLLQRSVQAVELCGVLPVRLFHLGQVGEGVPGQALAVAGLLVGIPGQFAHHVLILQAVGLLGVDQGLLLQRVGAFLQMFVSQGAELRRQSAFPGYLDVGQLLLAEVLRVVAEVVGHRIVIGRDFLQVVVPGSAAVGVDQALVGRHIGKAGIVAVQFGALPLVVGPLLLFGLGFAFIGGATVPFLLFAGKQGCLAVHLVTNVGIEGCIMQELVCRRLCLGLVDVFQRLLPGHVLAVVLRFVDDGPQCLVGVPDVIRVELYVVVLVVVKTVAVGGHPLPADDHLYLRQAALRRVAVADLLQQTLPDVGIGGNPHLRAEPGHQLGLAQIFVGGVKRGGRLRPEIPAGVQPGSPGDGELFENAAKEVHPSHLAQCVGRGVPLAAQLTDAQQDPAIQSAGAGTAAVGRFQLGGQDLGVVGLAGLAQRVQVYQHGGGVQVLPRCLDQLQVGLPVAGGLPGVPGVLSIPGGQQLQVGGGQRLAGGGQPCSRLDPPQRGVRLGGPPSLIRRRPNHLGHRRGGRGVQSGCGVMAVGTFLHPGQGPQRLAVQAGSLHIGADKRHLGGCLPADGAADGFGCDPGHRASPP